MMSTRKPVTVREIAVDEAINKLGQVSATMQLLLENIFSYETAELMDSKEEVFKALEILHSYPAWREVLSLTWEQVIAVREKLADSAMESDRARR